jgi:hypothetical protein
MYLNYNPLQANKDLDRYLKNMIKIEVKERLV